MSAVISLLLSAIAINNGKLPVVIIKHVPSICLAYVITVSYHYFSRYTDLHYADLLASARNQYFTTRAFCAQV